MRSIGIWGLREEARKSWDHFVSDKVVYLSESVEGNLERTVAEKYLDRDAWFEIHFTAQGESQREYHFQMMIEKRRGKWGDESLPVIQRKTDTERIWAERYRSMFVQGPEFIQLPEGIVPKSVPSEVRLKRVDDVCHCGWKQGPAVFIGVVPNLEDREMDLLLFPLGKTLRSVEVGQFPRELIQCGTEATDEIAKQHWDDLWGQGNINPDDIEPLIKLDLFGDGIRFRGPLPEFGVKRLEVFVRPAGLHFYVDKAIRSRYNHVESLRECGTIGA